MIIILQQLPVTTRGDSQTYLARNFLIPYCSSSPPCSSSIPALSACPVGIGTADADNVLMKLSNYGPLDLDPVIDTFQQNAIRDKTKEGRSVGTLLQSLGVVGHLSPGLLSR